MDCGPNLRTPGETAPVCANQAHQLVALVDRYPEVLAQLAQMVDQECARRPERIRAGSGFQRRDPAMFPGSGAIRLLPAGTRIESNDPLGRTAVNEEGQIDRQV